MHWELGGGLRSLFTSRELADADSASLPSASTGGDATQQSEIVSRGNRAAKLVQRRRVKRGTRSEKSMDTRRAHASKQKKCRRWRNRSRGVLGVLHPGAEVGTATGRRTRMEREAAGSSGIHHISTVKQNIMRERGVDAYRLPIVSAGKPDAPATTSCHQGDDIPGEN